MATSPGRALQKILPRESINDFIFRKDEENIKLKKNPHFLVWENHKVLISS